MRQILQKKNECFAVSAVMCLRHHLQSTDPRMADANVEHLYGWINHDGQEVWWPECAGIFRLRGVHPQEIINWYMYFNRTLYLIERFPRSAPFGLESRAKLIWDQDKSDARFWGIIQRATGILVMSMHAVAWDGKQVFCPRGQPWTDLELRSTVREFWGLTVLR